MGKVEPLTLPHSILKAVAKAAPSLDPKLSGGSSEATVFQASDQRTFV